MNITQATDYAFRAILYLTRQPYGKVVEAQKIAEAENIPMRFLLKIMPSLIKTGIIKSQRGVGGGYMLGKEAEEINFLDVIEAIEGPIQMNRCFQDTALCSKGIAPNCAVHKALADVQEKLIAELKKHNFAQLRQT